MPQLTSNSIWYVWYWCHFSYSLPWSWQMLMFRRKNILPTSISALQCNQWNHSQYHSFSQFLGDEYGIVIVIIMELFKAFVGLLSTHATTTIYYLHDPNEFHMHRRLIVPHQLATMPVQTSYSVQAQHQQHHLRSRSITQASERKMWSIFKCG